MKSIKIKNLLIVFVLSMTTPVFAGQVYDYWFDECVWNGSTGEILDYSGNANDGTAMGGMNTTDTEKVIDRAAYFDGVDDYVDTGKNLTILQYESASLSFWIKTTQTGNNITWRAPAVTGAEETGTTDDMYWGYLDAAGHIGLSVGDTNMVQSITPINDDAWYHVVLTRNAKTGVGKVYVNGVLEDSGTLNARVTYLDFQSIGRSEGVPDIYGGGYLEGYLDEVEIYDDVLSETQIGIIYDNESTGKNYDGTTRPAVYNCQGPVPYPNNYTWGTTVSGNLLTDAVDGSDSRVDTDPNGYAITINSYTQPAHGTVTVNPDGSFTYTADPGYVGPDTFTYTIINSNGDVSNRYSNVNLTATVANDDAYSTSQDTNLVGNVLDNDVYPTGTTIGSTDTSTLNGNLTIDTATGAFTYVPTPGFFGQTSFSYTIDDGNGNISTATVYITVEEVIAPPANLVAEYRMDECGFDHTTGDVIDNTINRFNGTSSGDTSISIAKQGNKICSAALFDGSGDAITVANNTELSQSGTNSITVSFWINLNEKNALDDNVVLGMYDSDGNRDKGWGFNFSDSNNRLDFFVGTRGGRYYEARNTINNSGWHHIVGVYDGARVYIYIDNSRTRGDGTNRTIRATDGDLTIGSSPNFGNDFAGQIDEVKIFSTAFSAAQVTAMYNNESAGRDWNEDTDTRECNTCQCTAAVGSNMVSLPADLRNMSSKTISDVIKGDITTYNYGSGNDWELARRDYDIVTDNKNNAVYTPLLESDDLEYGKAYWIANRTGTDINYTANLKTMDFDATVTDYPSCRSANGKCALIELQEPNGTDNNGPYIYNMTSFAVQKSIRWEDVRVLITDGGTTTSYTPDQAAALEETFNATIWRYDQDGTNYTNVTPGTPGLNNTIDPCSGYWVELDKNTAGKTVQLLIPEE